MAWIWFGVACGQLAIIGYLYQRTRGLCGTLEDLDERLDLCSRDPISAAEAYDSFYRGIVADALGRGE